MAGLLFTSLATVALLFFWTPSPSHCSPPVFEEAENRYVGACSGSTKQLNAYNGELTSYNYPNYYCNAYACRWQINHHDGGGSRVDFLTFNLRYSDYVMICDAVNGGGFTNCTYFYGGYSTYSIYGVSDYTYVEFRSFSSSCYYGFKVLYNTDPACRTGGTVLTKSSGNISSPYHPNNYPSYENCNWEIRGNTGDHVAITFQNFTLESSSSCYYDWVEIYDGSNFLGRYCGYNNPGTIVSASNSLRVYFNSDNSIYRAGFFANYEIRSPLPTTKPMLPPSIDIDMNATVYTTTGEALTAHCEMEYEVEMIYSAQIMVTQVNVMLDQGGLCSTTSNVHVLWVETDFIAEGNKASIAVDLEIPGQGQYKLIDMETCSTAILNYITTLSNWPQPILPDQPGCPPVYFNPNYFEDHDMMWCKPFEFQAKIGKHKYTKQSHVQPVRPRVPADKKKSPSVEYFAQKEEVLVAKPSS